MTKLVDYLPKLPEIHLNGLQLGLIAACLGVCLSWGMVSTLVILARGGSLFSDDPESATFIKLTRKYSPPFWRKVTFWTVCLEIALLILFVISLFVWHRA